MNPKVPRVEGSPYFPRLRFSQISQMIGGIGAGAVPGGSDTYVQYNDNGSFGGDSGFTYNDTTDTATVSNLVVGSLSGVLKAIAGAIAGSATTTDLTEGTNLYYTDERVDDRVAALLVAGTNITLTYNDVAGTLTIDASGGGTPGGANTQVQFNDSGAFGGDAGFTYNKTANAITVAQLVIPDNSATAFQILEAANNYLIFDTSDTVENMWFLDYRIGIYAGSLRLNKGIDLRLYDTDQSNYVGFKAPVLAADKIWTLPNADAGNTSMALGSNASAVLSWYGHDDLYGFVANEHIDHTAVSISTTTPLAGGGDISSTRTLTVGGLSTIGTANYAVGVNAAGNAWEYKQILGTADEIDITHAAGSITIGLVNPLAVTKGGTGLSATTINQILYSSAANTIAGLATANNGILVTGATGIPLIATDIPTAVTIGTAYIYRVGGTDVAVADGGLNLSTIAAGSVPAANALDTYSAITSTSGLKVLQNSAGTISWVATTGTGNNVFATSPTLTTPTIGAATATSIAIGANTLNTSEWANLDGVNQTLATTSTPQFARLGLGVAAHASNVLQLSSGATIGSTGAVNIDLANAADVALTLQNSGAGLADLTIDGSLTLSTNGQILTIPYDATYNITYGSGACITVPNTGGETYVFTAVTANTGLVFDFGENTMEIHRAGSALVKFIVNSAANGGGDILMATISQATEPTTTQIPAGYMAWWIDTDDSSLRLCYNQAGTVKTTAALT